MWRRADLIRDRITECESQLSEARAVGQRGSESRLLRELEVLRADLAREMRPAPIGRRRDDEPIANEPALPLSDNAGPAILSAN